VLSLRRALSGIASVSNRPPGSPNVTVSTQSSVSGYGITFPSLQDTQTGLNPSINLSTGNLYTKQKVDLLQSNGFVTLDVVLEGLAYISFTGAQYKFPAERLHGPHRADGCHQGYRPDRRGPDDPGAAATG
jgi:hypothetical protein